MRGLGLGVAAAAVAVQLPIFDRWLALLDEGYILALADEINRGKVLYRDVYVDAPFPGAFYLLAAWFRLVGTSVWASRLVIVAAFALFAVCVVRIGRELLPRAWAVGLAAVVLCYRVWAFPHWHIYSYSSIAATAVTAAVALVFVWLGTQQRLLLLAAGALAGVGILCKQDYGLGVSGAVGLFLLVRPLLRGRPKWMRDALGPAALFSLGALAVLAPAVAALAAAGALPGLVQQAIVVPLSGALGFGYTRLPPLWPWLRQDAALRAEIGSYFPSILLTLRWEEIAAGWLYRETPAWDIALKGLFYAPLTLAAVAAVLWVGGALARARREGATEVDERRLLLLAYAGGFLLAFNRPRDWVHLMMIYPPALAIAAVLLHDALARRGRAVRVLGSTTAAVALGVACLASALLASDLRRQLAWPLRIPRGGVFTDAVHGPIIEDVVGYVDRTVPPGVPVPVWPTQTMLEFLTGREAAAGFHVIWPVQGADRDARIIADLEARHIDTIIYSLSQYAHIGSFRTNAPQLYDYLVDHYTIAAVFAHEPWGPVLCALRRRTRPAAGTSLLGLVPKDQPAAPARWPFTDVLAAEVGTPAAPVVVRIPVTPAPDGARLTFRYGVNPERWLDLAAGPFMFALAVEDGTSRTELFRATTDPTHRLEDRRWIPQEVDLGAHAGRPVTLALTVTAPRVPRDPQGIAGWAEPMLVPQ